MDAVVEVGTATLNVEAVEVAVLAVVISSEVVAFSVEVPTSTLRVLSVCGHSISAVAPDLNSFKEDLAHAA
jgi:hypothetical protein